MDLSRTVWTASESERSFYIKKKETYRNLTHNDVFNLVDALIHVTSVTSSHLRICACILASEL